MGDIKVKKNWNCWGNVLHKQQTQFSSVALTYLCSDVLLKVLDWTNNINIENFSDGDQNGVSIKSAYF